MLGISEIPISKRRIKTFLGKNWFPLKAGPRCNTVSKQGRSFLEKGKGFAGCEVLCGSRGTDHEFADVILLRDSTRQMTVVAGEKAHTAFQNAKKDLMQFVGEAFLFCFSSESVCCSVTNAAARAAVITSFRCVAGLPPSPI